MKSFFGFGRGGYTARSLAGLISKCGLIGIGASLAVAKLYARYRKASDAATIRELAQEQKNGMKNFPLEESWMLKYSQVIDIDFLGVWDTVGALGLPFGELPILGKGDMQFLNRGLRLSNKFAFHALAVDEHRKAFAPMLSMVDFQREAPRPHRSRMLSQVEQRVRRRPRECRRRLPERSPASGAPKMDDGQGDQWRPHFPARPRSGPV